MILRDLLLNCYLLKKIILLYLKNNLYNHISISSCKNIAYIVYINNYKFYFITPTNKNKHSI